MALIDVRGLDLPPRLAGVSFSLEAGEMLGVIGPNGSGKSTLLHCLAGLLPCRGGIDFDGRPADALPPRQRARSIGLLPQTCDSAWSLSVEDVVALGRLPWDDRDEGAMRLAMQQTGVEAFRHRKVDHLSGGERARVWLARVLAGRPRLLLADEPIASLDLYHQRSVMETLRRYADAGNGVVIAIHDFSLAARYCDRLCLMHGGRLDAFGTPAEVLTENRLTRVFRVPVHVDLAARPPVITTQ
ncbi:ABC transporter ATP-binding protein [Pseudothauera rhizosphaerae]|uniref:ABC transporter ATP-binding protein n=1 Tax=Pseudothauera rhizosphaerae TaxID=2565932 RepID=A0A4S4AHA2_9RHOO|nr:ABC transporter ATP-binding protein [Pseudothauera rhizosphaerae]THF58652.1 ABC transporter ATP-binding protein [Pseudothauera rhizosphaerae]